MLLVCGILLFTLSHATRGEVPNVEPEFLNTLREAGQHKAFAYFLGIDDVNLVLPQEGRSEEDMLYTTVSPLGDILLTSEQEEHARQGLNFNRYPRSKWPNNRIPYVISSDFNNNERNQITSSVSSMNNRIKSSGLKVVPRNGESDYVMVISGNGCYSRLGKVGGQQSLSIQKNGCMRTGTIQHEFLHAAGFMHEQCRPDRDDYVRILWNNIPEDWHSQYEKMNSRDYGIHGPYEEYSVMHYGVNAPGTNKPAFEFKRNVDRSRIGQRNGVTQIDVDKVHKLYP